MAVIDILLNGETRQVPKNINLRQLLERFSLPDQRVAVELNNGVVRRVAWPETVIMEGDKIEVVHFVGGG